MVEIGNSKIWKAVSVMAGSKKKKKCMQLLVDDQDENDDVTTDTITTTSLNNLSFRSNGADKNISSSSLISSSSNNSPTSVANFNDNMNVCIPNNAANKSNIVNKVGLLEKFHLNVSTSASEVTCNMSNNTNTSQILCAGQRCRHKNDDEFFRTHHQQKRRSLTVSRPTFLRVGYGPGFSSGNNRRNRQQQQQQQERLLLSSTLSSTIDDDENKFDRGEERNNYLNNFFNDLGEHEEAITKEEYVNERQNCEEEKLEDYMNADYMSTEYSLGNSIEFLSILPSSSQWSSLVSNNYDFYDGAGDDNVEDIETDVFESLSGRHVQETVACTFPVRFPLQKQNHVNINDDAGLNNIHDDDDYRIHEPLNLNGDDIGSDRTSNFMKNDEFYSNTSFKRDITRSNGKSTSRRSDVGNIFHHNRIKFNTHEAAAAVTAATKAIMTSAAEKVRTNTNMRASNKINTNITVIKNEVGWPITGFNSPPNIARNHMLREVTNNSTKNNASTASPKKTPENVRTEPNSDSMPMWANEMIDFYKQPPSSSPTNSEMTYEPDKNNWSCSPLTSHHSIEYDGDKIAIETDVNVVLLPRSVDKRDSDSENGINLQREFAAAVCTGKMDVHNINEHTDAKSYDPKDFQDHQYQMMKTAITCLERGEYHRAMDVYATEIPNLYNERLKLLGEKKIDGHTCQQQENKLNDLEKELGCVLHNTAVLHNINGEYDNALLLEKSALEIRRELQTRRQIHQQQTSNDNKKSVSSEDNTSDDNYEDSKRLLFSLSEVESTIESCTSQYALGNHVSALSSLQQLLNYCIQCVDQYKQKQQQKYQSTRTNIAKNKLHYNSSPKRKDWKSNDEIYGNSIIARWNACIPVIMNFIACIHFECRRYGASHDIFKRALDRQRDILSHIVTVDSCDEHVANGKTPKDSEEWNNRYAAGLLSVGILLGNLAVLKFKMVQQNSGTISVAENVICPTSAKIGDDVSDGNKIITGISEAIWMLDEALLLLESSQPSNINEGPNTSRSAMERTTAPSLLLGVPRLVANTHDIRDRWLCIQEHDLYAKNVDTLDKSNNGRDLPHHSEHYCHLDSTMTPATNQLGINMNGPFITPTKQLVQHHTIGESIYNTPDLISPFSPQNVNIDFFHDGNPEATFTPSLSPTSSSFLYTKTNSKFSSTNNSVLSNSLGDTATFDTNCSSFGLVGNFAKTHAIFYSMECIVLPPIDHHHKQQQPSSANNNKKDRIEAVGSDCIRRAMQDNLPQRYQEQQEQQYLRNNSLPKGNSDNHSSNGINNNVKIADNNTIFNATAAMTTATKDISITSTVRVTKEQDIGTNSEPGPYINMDPETVFRIAALHMELNQPTEAMDGLQSHFRVWKDRYHSAQKQYKESCNFFKTAETENEAVSDDQQHHQQQIVDYHRHATSIARVRLGTALYGIGVLHIYQEEYASAKSALRRSLSLIKRPTKNRSHSKIFSEAEDWLSSAAQSTKSSPHLSKSLLARRLSHSKYAHLHDIGMVPTLISIRYKLGLAYVGLGEYGLGIEVWSNILSFHSESNNGSKRNAGNSCRSYGTSKNECNLSASLSTSRLSTRSTAVNHSLSQCCRNSDSHKIGGEISPAHKLQQKDQQSDNDNDLQTSPLLPLHEQIKIYTSMGASFVLSGQYNEALRLCADAMQMILRNGNPMLAVNASISLSSTPATGDHPGTHNSKILPSSLPASPTSIRHQTKGLLSSLNLSPFLRGTNYSINSNRALFLSGIPNFRVSSPVHKVAGVGKQGGEALMRIVTKILDRRGDTNNYHNSNTTSSSFSINSSNNYGNNHDTYSGTSNSSSRSHYHNKPLLRKDHRRSSSSPALPTDPLTTFHLTPCDIARAKIMCCCLTVMGHVKMATHQYADAVILYEEARNLMIAIVLKEQGGRKNRNDSAREGGNYGSAHDCKHKSGMYDSGVSRSDCDCIRGHCGPCVNETGDGFDLVSTCSTVSSITRAEDSGWGAQNWNEHNHLDSKNKLQKSKRFKHPTQVQVQLPKNRKNDLLTLGSDDQQNNNASTIGNNSIHNPNIGFLDESCFHVQSNDDATVWNLSYAMAWANNEIKSEPSLTTPLPLQNKYKNDNGNPSQAIKSQKKADIIDITHVYREMLLLSSDA